MATSAATKPVTSPLLTTDIVAPVSTLPALPTPAEVQAPEPQPSKLSAAWSRFLASPHGRAMQTVVGGMRGFAAGTAPAIVLGGVGYAIGDHNAYEYSANFGATFGVIGGFITNALQFGNRDELIPTFKRLNHKHPYFASCLNVTLCAGLPATIAGFAASHYGNGGWGVAAGVLAGVLGMVYCTMAQDERVKDAEQQTSRVISSSN